MVTTDEIEEQDLTKSDVLDREFEEPMQHVEMLPEWEEYPEEAPGENTRVEDDVLKWERDGFSVELESDGAIGWKARVSVPSEVGGMYAMPKLIKANPEPKRGFVEDVTVEDYAATEVVLWYQENFQPTYEVNKWIDARIEDAESSQAFQEEVEEKLAAASENE